MSSIGSAIDFMANCYTDPEEIAERTSRKYGIPVDEVLVDVENKVEAINCLQTILDVLSDTQRQVLLTRGAGYTQKEAAEIIGITQPAYSGALKSIPERLYDEADEERIQFLAEEVVRLAGTSRGRHSEVYAALCEELDRRYAVREALKKIVVLLTPPASTKEMTGHVNLPAYTFERLMEVNEGMKEGVLNGYKVMKTVTKCRIPEYMRESFKDNYVCCTLCATCKRKKDVYGRKGYGQYGLDTRCSIE